MGAYARGLAVPPFCASWPCPCRASTAQPAASRRLLPPLLRVHPMLLRLLPVRLRRVCASWRRLRRSSRAQRPRRRRPARRALSTRLWRYARAAAPGCLSLPSCPALLCPLRRALVWSLAARLECGGAPDSHRVPSAAGLFSATSLPAHRLAPRTALLGCLATVQDGPACAAVCVAVFARQGERKGAAQCVAPGVPRHRTQESHRKEFYRPQQGRRRRSRVSFAP